MRGRGLPPAPRIGWGRFPRAMRTLPPSERHQPGYGYRCRKVIVRNISSDCPWTYAALLQRSPLPLRPHTSIILLLATTRARPSLTSYKFFFSTVFSAPLLIPLVPRSSRESRRMYVCARISLGHGARKRECNCNSGTLLAVRLAPRLQTSRLL